MVEVSEDQLKDWLHKADQLYGASTSGTALLLIRELEAKLGISEAPERALGKFRDLESQAT